MKNIFFLFSFLLSSIILNAQTKPNKVRFFNDVKITSNSSSKTLTIKINEENSKFSDVFVLLLKNNDVISNFRNFNNNIGNIIFDKKTLKIENKNQSIMFTVENSKEDNSVEVLGISRFHGEFNSEDEIRFNPYIGGLISNESLTARPMNCTAGGPGSNQCGVSSEIMGVMTQCEVSCNTGYYACCDDGVGKCKCIQNNKKPSLVEAKIEINKDDNIKVTLNKNKILNITGSGLKEGCNIIILDLNGKEVINSQINSFKNIVDLNFLTTNLYYYKIINNDKNVSKQGKILIQ